MNLERLREAEAGFLQLYPLGFSDPAIQPLRRKHNVARLVAYAQENLTRERCHRPVLVAQVLGDLVARSSMVSRFEKPPFRAFLDALGSREREALARAVEQRLFGRRRRGFEELVAMLAWHGIAKWTVVSAAPFYAAPRREVFVKPSTAKRILAGLEVDDLQYGATPTWTFYRGFRALLAEVRRRVHPSLSPTQAALTGFLMMQL